MPRIPPSSTLGSARGSRNTKSKYWAITSSHTEKKPSRPRAHSLGRIVMALKSVRSFGRFQLSPFARRCCLIRADARHGRQLTVGWLPGSVSDPRFSDHANGASRLARRATYSPQRPRQKHRQQAVHQFGRQSPSSRTRPWKPAWVFKAESIPWRLEMRTGTDTDFQGNPVIAT